MPKILLADDSTHAQRMGTKILSGEGMEVVAVSNGEAAVKKLQDTDFDLVLADVYMPGLDGYEVCQWVKKSADHAGLPVVLVVGALEIYEPDRIEQVAADGLLKKPFEASAMLETVRPLLVASAASKSQRKKKEPDHEATMPVYEKTVLITAPVVATAAAAVALEELKPSMDDTVEIDPIDMPAPAPEPAPSATIEKASHVLEEMVVPEMEPYPVSLPDPEPAPEPEPVNIPEPEPHPAPMPEPVQEPELEPMPVTADFSPSDVVDEIPSMEGIYPNEGAAAEPEPEPEPELEELLPVESALEPEVLPVVEPAVVEAAWIAEPLQVTEEDQTKFEEPVVAAAAPAAPAAPDWGDLLASVEDGAPPPAPAPEPVMTSDLELEMPEAAPEPAPPAPPPAPKIDEEAVRMAVQLCLENALPGLVDEITSAVLRRIGPTE